ncbi:MAG: beta-lactamase family protein [Acidobacteria bacterium]|nr:beta-lactamase family protein [Acidobacteriota bacterium]
MRHKILFTIGLILLWTLAVIAVVFAEAIWFAQPAVTRGDSASIEKHLVQKLSDETVNRSLGSAALVLVQGGKIAAEHGFGVANAETQAPVKTDQTLQTLEESLTRPKDTNTNERPGVTVVRDPGTAMSYSSSAGYTILQLLIEEVTNRSFADYMKESVLQPLGMTKSSFDLDAIVSESRTQDLATSFDRDLKPHPHRRHTAKAAVSLRATPHDLAQFVLAYTEENPVLRQETLKQMMTPQPGTSATWGLGQTLYVENDSGGHVVGHSGGSFPAMGASVRVNPATGNGFVLLVSGGRGESTNQLSHDWVYWETGKVTFEARLQIVQNRLAPSSLAIIFGAIALVLWKLLK